MNFLYKLIIKFLSFFDNFFLQNNYCPFNKIIESIEISKSKIIEKSIKLREVSIIKYEYPKKFHNFFRHYRVFHERKLYVIKSGIFVNEKGCLLTEDKEIILESYGSIKKLLFWDDVRPWLFNTVKIINNRGDYYYFFRDAPFYHFLIEELPVLITILKYFPNITLLISNKKKSNYFIDSLNFIKDKNAQLKVVTINEKNNIKVNNAVFIQREKNSGGIHINDIKLLNEFFSESFEPIDNYSKIYISRTKNLKRKIQNEVEVEEFLKKLNFQILYLENYSFIEQINLLQKAETIVAPHGAGLANIIWNPDKKKKVIEIFPSYVKNDCFAGIAMSLEYEYDYLICDNLNGKEFCDIEQLSKKLK